MFWFFFSIYTIFMVLIFGFFIVAKIHVYKFRDYSLYIEPVTRVLAVILVVLALVGYYFIYSGSNTASTSTKSIEETMSTEIY